jgi:hypothetical protein
MVTKQTSKKKLSKKDFKEKLLIIKLQLPNNYGVLMSHYFPGTCKRTVYNVVNYSVHNEDVLEKLKFLILSKN